MLPRKHIKSIRRKYRVKSNGDYKPGDRIVFVDPRKRDVEITGRIITQHEDGNHFWVRADDGASHMVRPENILRKTR